MWWLDFVERWRRPAAHLIVACALAALTACGWQPLYGKPAGVNSESVKDKFLVTEISPIDALHGTPAERVAVGMFNALQFDLHGGATAVAPIYRLVVTVGTQQYTAVIDPITGRATTQIATVSANYSLIEIATGKEVVHDNCSAEVDTDVPGSQQRFASQRGQRDAEDRAILVAAEAIRNRLASYFVAGT
jgi:LPS-assembly lipoprotein